MPIPSHGKLGGGGARQPGFASGTGDNTGTPARGPGFASAHGKNANDGGQPPSASPSVSKTGGLHAKGKHHQKTDGVAAKQRGTLNDDLAMGRMGKSYMHNPAFRPGAEDQKNHPKQLPSRHIVTHGDDDHAIAHSHMDNARKAKTTDEKRKHVFSALGALNKAKKKGY